MVGMGACSPSADTGTTLMLQLVDTGENKRTLINEKEQEKH